MNFIKNKWFLISIVVILIGTVLITFKGQHVKSSDITEQVTLGTIKEEVSVTGRVKPSNNVDLSFEKSGKVVSVYKNVGDRVTPGSIILVQDNSDLIAQRDQASAALKYQEAKYNQLVAGTRPEELKIQETKIANAEVTISDTQKDLLLTLQSSYTSADDAVRNKVDQFISNARTNNPVLNFTTDPSLQGTIISGRVEVETRLNALQTLTMQLSTSSDIVTASTLVKQDLAEIKLFLDNIALAVNGLMPNANLSQTTISGWRNDVSNGRLNINAVITSILAAEEKIKASQSDLSVLQGELDLQKAGNVSEELDAQQAQIDQAKATISAIDAQLSKTYIRSPIFGIITKQDAKTGEIVSANNNLVSIISDSKFQIEANIAEADISKIKVGELASVTLDAYGPDSIFAATVVKIDPAETIVDSVPTYKTTFEFSHGDDRIKSGMTANITITGETHDNAISVPQHAVFTRDGKKYVTVKKGEVDQDVVVATGIHGADGKIEITSGLTTGDLIVTSGT